MKKSLLLLFAFIATMTAFAQDNLAQGATAIATSGNAALAVDGDKGTRWEAEASDPQTWQVDLGEAKTFNTISIVWEGAYTSTFTIEAGDAVDGDGYLTGGTQIVTVEGQTLAGFPYTQNFKFASTTARYVKFTGTARGTQWGHSFWEFGIYNLAEDLKLTELTITAAANRTTVGSTINITAAGKDQLGGAIAPEGLTWESTDPAVGTVVDGVFTALAAGTTTVTAKAGDVTSNGVDITVSAGTKIDLFTNWQYRIYPLGDDTKAAGRDGLVDENDGSLWEMHATTAADEESRTYETGFVADLGAIYDINNISIHFEGACSEAFTLAFAGNDGVFAAPAYTGGVAGINNHTEVFSGETVTGARYVKFLSTKASSEWGVKIFDFSVVGTKTADATFNAPVITAATAGATTDESITLNLNATNDGSAYVMYEVAANGVPATYFAAKAGEATDVVISNLAAGTTYNFAIYAINANGDRSAIKELSVATTGDTFVLTVAPTPTHDMDDVLSIYSDAYTPATAYNFGGWGQATVVTPETVGGDEMLHLTNYNYLGFEYATDIDLSEMKYIHIDILPMKETGFGITPIMRGGVTEKSTSVGTLNVKEWNSIDLPLADFGFDFTYKSFQLKIDGGNASDVYVDNIYFWKGEGSDEPVVDNPTSGEGSYTIPSGLNEGKELKYTWAYTQTGMDVTVTYACTNASEITGIVDGYVHDKTDGFAEREGLTYTWTNCTKGQVITSAHKWMFAEGDFVTPDFTYTVKDAVEPEPVLPAIPEEPTADAENVLVVYSAKYGKEEITTSSPGWGGYKDATGEDLYTSFDYVELKGEGDATHKVVHVIGAGINSRTKDDLPATGYNKVHAAIYPTTATSGVIFKDNGYDSRITISGLVPGQWNYIEESVDFDNAYITIALDGETEFYTDHIYYEQVPDTEAPVITDFTGNAGYTSAVITATATDDSNGTISYTFTLGETVKEATAASGTAAEVTFDGLELGTEYTVEIVAKDAAGNASEMKNIIFETNTLPEIAAAPAPTAGAEYVQGIYTDAYATPATGVAFMNWHGADVTAEEIAASNNAADNIYRIYTNKGFGFYGMQLDKAYDLSTFKTIHVDIWSNTAATIGFSPINQATEPHTAKKELTLAGGWNQFDIDITDYSDMNVTTVDQLEFFDAPADIVIGIDNIFFVSDNVLTSINSVANGNQSVVNGKIFDLQGREVRNPQKGIYIIDGIKVVIK